MPGSDILNGLSVAFAAEQYLISVVALMIPSQWMFTVTEPGGKSDKTQTGVKLSSKYNAHIVSLWLKTPKED